MRLGDGRTHSAALETQLEAQLLDRREHRSQLRRRFLLAAQLRGALLTRGNAAGMAESHLPPLEVGLLGLGRDTRSPLGWGCSTLLRIGLHRSTFAPRSRPRRGACQPVVARGMPATQCEAGPHSAAGAENCVTPAASPLADMRALPYIRFR